MSYLVLARKWRPQVFEEVLGQRSITQTLQNAIAQNRVAHAFLFTGPRGVGKTSTARILAKALNCETGPAANPCNVCTSCREISAGSAIDVIEIDGASNRRIDEIRELRENTRYTPARSRYKIFIIDEVHMLTNEAFNALLKTLEEPPSYVVFIFATTEPHKIPMTILSRCQRYDFKRVPPKEIAASLGKIVEKEGIRISSKGLFYIARGAEGSMRDAQSLLDRVISFAGTEVADEDVAEALGLFDRKVLYDTFDAVADRDAGRCLEIVGLVYDYGHDLSHFFLELLQHLRNLILMKVSKHPEQVLDLSEEELSGYRRQADRFQFEQLNHLFSLLLKGEEEVSQSSFPRTMLEMTLIRMASLPPVIPIEEILQKIDRLTGGTGPQQAASRIGSPLPLRGGSSAPSAREPARPVPTHREGEKINPVPAAPAREPDRIAPPPADMVPDEEDLEESPAPDLDITMASAVDSGVEAAPAGPPQEGAWRDLLDFARARNPILGAFLVLGSLIRLEGETVEIGFAKESFHYERMMEKENRSQLERICDDYLQKKAKVILTPLDLKAPVSGGAPPARMGEDRTGNAGGPAEGGAAHPLIQETLRLFGGKIVQG
jgi:DNA polymerase III subunit gamma/tau